MILPPTSAIFLLSYATKGIVMTDRTKNLQEFRVSG